MSATWYIYLLSIGVSESNLFRIFTIIYDNKFFTLIIATNINHNESRAILPENRGILAHSFLEQLKVM